MTQQEATQRLQAIHEEAEAKIKAIYAEVLVERLYPDGARMRCVRRGEDGVVFDDFTATIVGAGCFTCESTMLDNGRLVGGYPNVYYSLRVDSPADYNSRRSSAFYPDIPHGRFECFWQGDEHWTLLEPDSINANK